MSALDGPGLPLASLIDGLEGVRLARGDAGVRVSAIALDSRQVVPGALFAALPGTRADGLRFVPQALAAGARALLVPAGAVPADLPPGCAVLEATAVRLVLARLTARLIPAQPQVAVAVTGTNGKSSVVHFLFQLWQAAGHAAAGLGTLGLETAGGLEPGALTTPDVVSLHQGLAALTARGITHLAFEASSHGLDQHRVDGVRLAAAGFTNLSRDHLDYHGTMEAYRAAKARLLTQLLPPGGPAAIWRPTAATEAADHADWMATAARDAGRRVITCGHGRGHDVAILAQQPTARGQTLSLAAGGLETTAETPLMGLFQAENVAVAVALAMATGMAATRALTAVARLTAVRGRMEPVAVTPAGGLVLVDYAHTPDALTTVLRAARPHATGRVVALTGAGGDRDPGKRPLMGRACAEGAELVIITDDNPRSEDPAAIRAAVRAGAPAALEIPGRAEAIAQAVALLQSGDVLVIAGKGHEQGQIVGATVLPFDDAAVARAAVEALSP